MGVVFVEGIVILVLVLCGLRRAIIEAIPAELRLAIGIGVGVSGDGLGSSFKSAQGTMAVVSRREPRYLQAERGRRIQQMAPRTTSGMPATRPRGEGPSSVCPQVQNTRPKLANALNDPCARAQGHTLPVFCRR